MRREQPYRVTGIEYQRLFIRHFGEIFHCNPVLRPVLEHGTVPTICNQFMGMLCHGIVKIIAQHKHNGSSLHALVRKIIYTACINLIIGPVPVHIYPAVLLKFLCKLPCQKLVLFLWKISQGIPQGKPLLLRRKNLFSARSMVHTLIIRFCRRYRRRDTFTYSISEIIHKLIFKPFVNLFPTGFLSIHKDSHPVYFSRQICHSHKSEHQHPY